jgi:hypothetical protein
LCSPCVLCIVHFKPVHTPHIRWLCYIALDSNSWHSEQLTDGLAIWQLSCSYHSLDSSQTIHLSIPIFHQFVVYNCVIPILYWFECSFQTLFSNFVLSAPSTFAGVGFTCNGGRLWRTCLGCKSTVRKTGYALEWAQVQPITS